MGAPLGGVAAVILAAGRSERLADPVPKPFRRVAGLPLIEYSRRAFEESESVSAIVMVVPQDLRERLEASLGALRPFGRVIACGAISRYNDESPSPGPRNFGFVVTTAPETRSSL